jgi:hypothetical protein
MTYIIAVGMDPAPEAVTAPDSPYGVGLSPPPLGGKVEQLDE